MRVMVLGAGGREHALAWRLSRDPEVESVWVAPGNEGIAREHRVLAVPASDAGALITACREHRIDLVVVGPEAPLAAGLADALTAAGITTYGPSAAAARLEASKAFAKEVLASARVPTARASAFDSLAAARAALDGFGPPWVIKQDGLAAGKGVCVTESRREAESFLKACFEGGRFAAGGQRILLEEFMRGEEASVMAVCDGERFLLLPAARDYKRALDGDRGPNTGGMGAVAPTPAVDAALEAAIGERIVAPVLAEMAGRGTAFRGTLYAGLMLGDPEPRVVEFNVRFGDPEAQAILPLVTGSFARLLLSAARGALVAGAVGRADGAAVAIALVDAGYPDAVRGGGLVRGLVPLRTVEHIRVFFAGGAWEGDHWRVSGGRTAYVVATGVDHETARGRAVEAVATLGGDGWRARSDIARIIEKPGQGSAPALTAGRTGSCG